MRALAAIATLLTMAVFSTVFAAPPAVGIPTAVHYFDHDKVAATLAKGGNLVSDPGLTINATRRGAAKIEYHDNKSHVMFIMDGEATLVAGGTMVDPKRTEPGQMTASEIEGGEVYHLTKGDVITIPAKTPHWWKEVPTKTIAYYSVDIEN